MTVDEYYECLGLPPLPFEHAQKIFEQIKGNDEVKNFENLQEQFLERGDLESGQAFYRAYYSLQVPGAGMAWFDIDTRVFYRNLDQKVLPKIAEFCDGATRVLEAGCGAGNVLCYVALQNPKSQVNGADLRPEGLELARGRIKKLGLTNVTLLERDVFNLQGEFADRFDRVILKDIIDDSREKGTPFLDGKFDTVRKLCAIRELLTPKGLVWFSLTSFPVYSWAFEERLSRELREAGFRAGNAERITYTMVKKTCTHLGWILEQA